MMHILARLNATISSSRLGALSVLVCLVWLGGYNNLALGITLSESNNSYHPGKELLLLEDQSASLTIADIIQKSDAEFTQSVADVPNAGFSNSAHWIKLKIANQLLEKTLWYLELAYPPSDYVDVFFYQDNSLIHSGHTGDQRPFAERDLQYPNYTFRFFSMPNQTLTVYMRIKSESSVQFPLTVYSADSLAEKISTDTLLAGIYYGIIVVIVLYNFFLFVSIKESHYVIYVIYISLFGIAQFSVQGYSYQYFWPSSPWWASHNIVFFYAISIMFAGLFTKLFLRASENAPKLNHVTTIAVFCLGCSAVLALLGSYAVSVKILAVLTVITCPLFFSVGVVAWKTGYSPARYFVWAGASVFAFTVLWTLKTFGLMPSNIFTENCMKIGSAIEVILLSLALGDRINFEKMEKVRAQQLAVDNLQQSNELKNSFLATVSHELRTPMNGIIGSLELIEAAEQEGESIQSTLEAAESSAHNMQSLVEDILCFADAQTDGFMILNENFNLRESVQTSVEHYRNLCKTKGLHFNYFVDPLLESHYKGDAKRLERIIIHLLDNGVKFTNKGQVSLSLRKQSEFVPDKGHTALHINVTDTGIGIDKEIQGDIFDAFRQADGTFTRLYGGLGIGLAICHALVKALGGTISFSSNSQGTSFDVIVFLADATAVQLPTENKIASNHPPLSVLVVEDNPVNRMILGNLIQKMEHQVHTAVNGLEAVDKFKSESIDFVFMDCQMPVMDGYNATRKLRELDPHVPIVAVTANALEQDRKKCFSVGMNDFISKPIKKGIIADKIALWHPNVGYGHLPPNSLELPKGDSPIL